MDHPQKTRDVFELETVQKWFQAVITHPGGVGEGVLSESSHGVEHLDQMILPSGKLDASGRIAVYANAYYARLLECLAETFPILSSALGNESFDEFAFGYLQTHPSSSYTLEHLADRFPDFLEDNRPGPEADPAMAHWAGFLVDLARLELLIEKVFDGPGMEQQDILKPQELAVIAPEAWASAKLVPVVCLNLLKCDYPVNDYFTEAREADDPTTLNTPGPADQFVAITRRDYIVRRHTLEREQYLLLKALQGGATVAQAIEAAAFDSQKSDEEFASALRTWFAEWSAAQLFERIET